MYKVNNTRITDVNIQVIAPVLKKVVPSLMEAINALTEMENVLKVTENGHKTVDDMVKVLGVTLKIKQEVENQIDALPTCNLKSRLIKGYDEMDANFWPIVHGWMYGTVTPKIINDRIAEEGLAESVFTLEIQLKTVVELLSLLSTYALTLAKRVQKLEDTDLLAS